MNHYALLSLLHGHYKGSVSVSRYPRVVYNGFYKKLGDHAKNWGLILMHFKLKDQNGNIISPFLNPDDKPVIRIHDEEYEIIELSDNYSESDAMSDIIADFDADPEIKRMIEESERDIEAGHVFSTKQVIEMIKNGEI